MGKLDTLGAAWPMLKRALRSRQFFRPQCELYEPDPDIESHFDVPIEVPGGFELTANIFRSRSAGDAARPTIMCAHPYDNRKISVLGNTPFGGPPSQYRLIPQAGARPRFSTLTSWESPDPGFWVPAGYNLVNLNLPGFANSGGPPTILSEHQGQTFRDAIAWVGEQPWSDGGVGLCGVSFLCISQYLAAAVPDGQKLPNALKCIIPWEGVSNLYHDLVCRAGVADIGFLDFWWHTEVKESMNVPLEEYLAIEEAIPPKILDRHPMYDDYWRAKAPPLENITVPMLVGASFSDHELHTMGTFRAYEKASSDKKWLYTHRNGKWAEFYSPECLELQRQFMDHFLRQVENDFAEAPYIRLEVRSDRETIKEVRREREWPLPHTEYERLFLTSDGLANDESKSSAEVSYDAQNGQARFEMVFDDDTELSGYMMLKVWVEVRPAAAGLPSPQDVALCGYVDKLDKTRAPIRFNGSVGSEEDVLTRGYCRASRRALDVNASKPWLPIPAGDSHLPLKPGEVVPLHFAFCPSSTFFYAGEGLRLTVSPRDTVHAPIFQKVTSDNKGLHVLHFGGAYDSYLLVPRIPVAPP
ncbi:MAG: CocE/NonD family hydrolase [Pseudomonadota bacterium]